MEHVFDLACNTYLRMADANWCALEHVPPYLRNMTAGMYRPFCVVRNPIERMLSAFRYRMAASRSLGESFTCDAQFLNLWMQEYVAYAVWQPFHDGCFKVPQIDFIRHPQSGELTCQYVLDFANLNSELQALMDAEGVLARQDLHWIGRDVNHASTCSGVSEQDLWPDTLSLLAAVYSEDLRLYDLVSRLPLEYSSDGVSSLPTLELLNVRAKLASKIYP